MGRSTARRWAIIHELREEAEPPLEELVARMSPADLVIVEGFKRFGHPKIEAHRRVMLPIRCFSCSA